jgi:hypothetical protein
MNKMDKTKKAIKLKPWSEIHKKKYEWLYNYILKTYPEAKKETYIDIYKRQILSIIKNNSSWGNSSKEGLYFMVGRYLDNKNDRYAKTYKEEGFKLMKANQEKENENELDDKEKENFRTHEYFLNILSNIIPDEIKTIEGHYKYLLLNLLVYQPPLRTSFYTTAKLIRSKDDNDKLNNFVLINRRGKIKAYYIVNKDKATNYKLYAINKNLSKIELESSFLSKLINESLIKYPRTYLFEINNKPISDNTYLNWLRDITKTEKINNDMMRSSYITWFYENNLKFSDRDKLSKLMRHSTTTAQRNYNKVFITENNIDINEVKKINQELTLLKYENQELKRKLKEFDKTDDEKIDDKHFRKKRYDVIYNLNIKGRTPREATLKEYNIKYDATKKQYI